MSYAFSSAKRCRCISAIAKERENMNHVDPNTEAQVQDFMDKINALGPFVFDHRASKMSQQVQPTVKGAILSHVLTKCSASSCKVSPQSLLFRPALQDAWVLCKGVVHKLLHAASLLLLGGLPQLVVVPLNPPAPLLASQCRARSSKQAYMAGC